MTCPPLPAALEAARNDRHEDPARARAVAIRCRREADACGDLALRARALALEGMLTLYEGDLREAFRLAAAAVLAGEQTTDDAAHVEVAALEAHLSFFTGSYNEALRHARRMTARAAQAPDLALQLYAQRCACLVFGNLDEPEFPKQLDGVLELAIACGNRWEEAISRNDLAHRLMTVGELPAAEAELERAMAVARTVRPRHGFALGVLHCTRAEVRLAAGRPQAALADAAAASEHLGRQEAPNPFLIGMTVQVEVKALLACGRPEDALRRGRDAVERLRDGLPQVRSTILRDVASALHEAGRAEEAYRALAESAELERIAFRELSELHRELDRALQQAGAARHEAERLREQADRDWLTGLHNRRYLSRAVDAVAERDAADAPVSIAVLDLDHFKAVNDTFGHDAGDRVLVRVASLLLDVVRASDVVARTGGEEFVVLMPGTDPAAASACAERVRRAIEAEPWDALVPGLAVTASVGVASAPASADLRALAALADRRLYAAKDAGRNLVHAG